MAGSGLEPSKRLAANGESELETEAKGDGWRYAASQPSSMQSAVFLALHSCTPMERSASNCQSQEEKKGKRKKTM